jgi:iron complex outermembrane receptor protein
MSPREAAKRRPLESPPEGEGSRARVATLPRPSQQPPCQRSEAADFDFSSSFDKPSLFDTVIRASARASHTKGCRPMVDPNAVVSVTSLLLSLCAIGFAQPAVAQQPDTAHSPEALKKLSVEQLMNVEVMSVSKRTERLSRTASAIQVITQEDIRRSSASSLPEALRLATNLQVAQVDSRQWAVSARGFNSTTANKLLVLIDGRTVYTPLYSGVFWDVQDVPLSDVERIEVISGPGATLWGANAVNGVINVITKNARDTHGLLVTGGGGTTLRGFGTARYGGELGPGVRFRVYGTGFTRQPSLLPSGLDATDDWHLEQGGFRLDWDKSKVTRVTVQGDLYDGRIAQPGTGDVAVNGGNAVV